MKLTLSLLIVFSSWSFSKNIGSVKILRGTVTVQRGEESLALKRNSWVNEGDIITTGKRSFVRLRLTDDSKINLGPESKVKLQKISSNQPGVIDVIAGKLRGEISKDYLKIDKKKSKLYVKSKTALMGIRGTDFLFSYSPKAQKTSVVLFEGEVVLNKLEANRPVAYENFEKSLELSSVTLRPGEFTQVSSSSSAPSEPTKMDAGQFKQLEKSKTLLDKDERTIQDSAQIQPQKVSSQKSSGMVDLGPESNKGIETADDTSSDDQTSLLKNDSLPPRPEGEQNRPPSLLREDPKGLEPPKPIENRRGVKISIQD